jgi:hypothetical protein
VIWFCHVVQKAKQLHPMSPGFAVLILLYQEKVTHSQNEKTSAATHIHCELPVWKAIVYMSLIAYGKPAGHRQLAFFAWDLLDLGTEQRALSH